MLRLRLIGVHFFSTLFLWCFKNVLIVFIDKLLMVSLSNASVRQFIPP